MLRCQHFAGYPAGVPRTRRRTPPPVVDEVHLAAWRALLTAHAAVVACIDRELALADGNLVPLTWYDVLIELFEAPDQRLRQRDLARSVVLTRSGISRLIDRMATAGLVRREPNPDDRRGDLVALTDFGRGALRRTWPYYARGIASHFAQHLSADEAQVITAALERVRAASPILA
jgi:DNA-binding MarR family transcriptional regulator